MQRLERLVAIGEWLRRAAPHPVSARRLAEEFAVTPRTIERDLAALRAAGVPLYSESGRLGGAVSLDQAGNVVVTLSPSEVMALLTAVQAAGRSMPFADSGATAVGRILDALPSETRVMTEQLRDRTRTIDEAEHSIEDPSEGRVGRRVRSSIEEAVRRQVVVNIGYRDRNGVETQRSVDPVGFLRHTDGWYLIGWCHLRSAGRIFRFDRIVRANTTRRPCDAHDVDATLGWVPAAVRRP